MLHSLTTRRAQLNLETRATADSLQEITTKVMDSKEEQTRISTEKEHLNKSPSKGRHLDCSKCLEIGNKHWQWLPAYYNSTSAFKQQQC